MVSRLILFFTLVLFSITSAAQEIDCGETPPVKDETLRVKLDSKAQVLSKKLGGAELKAEIETVKSEIFSKYPNADTVVANQYLYVVTCQFLSQDKSLTTVEKLRELRIMRKELNTDESAVNKKWWALGLVAVAAIIANSLDSGSSNDRGDEVIQELTIQVPTSQP